MSKVRGNPASQQFNVSPRPNSKKNSWSKKSPFHNNAVKKVR